MLLHVHALKPCENASLAKMEATPILQANYFFEWHIVDILATNAYT